MTLTLSWLPAVIRVAIAPVFVGALAQLVESPRAPCNVAAVTGLLLLSAIHVGFWWRPWPGRQLSAASAVAGMVAIDFVLLNLLDLSEPLLWLYPALAAGAGLPAPIAVVCIGLTALAAAGPIAMYGQLVHPIGSVAPAAALGVSHSVLLSIVLAGLGMMAVRQLIAVNADLGASRAELADLAVARDRERLARELHDLLGRTLSLIAVKAELASRLSAKGDPSAAAELADVQRLARQAVRDVRDAVTEGNAPSVAKELVAAQAALEAAGITSIVDVAPTGIDPANETTLAWALREAVTNVVKHSGARVCRIALKVGDCSSVLEVEDDGRGPAPGATGTGLAGLAERIQAVGGTLDIGSSEGRGFKLRVKLGASAPRLARVESAP